MLLKKALFLLLFPMLPLAGQLGFQIHPYIQNPSPDGMSIIWFSSDSIQGLFSIGKPGYPQRTEIYSRPQWVPSLGYSHWEDSVFFNGNAPGAPYRHRIRVTGLESYSVYNYTVSQGRETFNSSFRTSPIGDTAIRFMVYGDSETEPESTGKHTTWIDPVSRIWRNYIFDQTTGYRNNLGVIGHRNPDLVLIAGDLVQHGGEQRDWDEFWSHNTHFMGDSSLAGRIPLFAAPGNHEYFEGSLSGWSNSLPLPS